MFSSAFRAFTTPVCRSARTLVVPPGVSEYRLFGDGSGACSEDVDRSASMGDSFRGGVRLGVEFIPSSASARALPEINYYK